MTRVQPALKHTRYKPHFHDMAVSAQNAFAAKYSARARKIYFLSLSALAHALVGE